MEPAIEDNKTLVEWAGMSDVHASQIPQWRVAILDAGTKVFLSPEERRKSKMR